MVDFAAILQAHTTIRRFIDASPLTRSIALSEHFGCNVFIKWDSTLRTGSFKERGAINFLSQLSPTKRKKGIVAASAGNHALPLSYYAKILKIPCTLVMPRTAPLVKVQSCIANGAHVITDAPMLIDAFKQAKQIAVSQDLSFAHAFDDPQMIAGQGTAGIEIIDQFSAQFTVKPDYVIVPVGGGGLISGITLAMKKMAPRAKIIGVRSTWANDLSATYPSKKRSPFSSTSLADGIGVKTTGILPQAIITKHAVPLVAVTEHSIARAIMLLLEKEHAVVEGAGASALASLLQHGVPKVKRSKNHRPLNIVICCCGSNIDLNVLSRLTTWQMGQQGRLLHLKASAPDKPGSLAVLTAIIAKEGGNVLDVVHDRGYRVNPGDVAIECTIEVKNTEHAKSIRAEMRKTGVTIMG